MKIKKLTHILTILFLLAFLLIPTVRANPVGFNYHIEYFWLKLFVLFFITVLIESQIIKKLIWEKRTIKPPKDLYVSVITVNFFTYPLTQLFALIVYQFYFQENIFFLFLYVIVELIPITIECLLYLKIFNNLTRLHYFENPVNSSIIIKSTIAANLVTFIIGYIVFLIYP